MRIFYELRYTVIIEIVWTSYLKSVPAKFQKYFKLISWVITGTSSSKLSCNPRHPSRNISCNHHHHLLQPSWRRTFSTSNNQNTRVDSDVNIDYKAFSFDKLYIWRRKWDTAGFVRAHQRIYWNALTVGRGRADDGCSCNHRAVPPQCALCLHIHQLWSQLRTFAITKDANAVWLYELSMSKINKFSNYRGWEWGAGGLIELTIVTSIYSIRVSYHCMIKCFE